MALGKEQIRETYDQVAAEYCRRYFDDLDRRPLDRELLTRFALAVRDLGPAADVGCGPGGTTRFLKDRGVDVFGVDLSEGMVKAARALNPDLRFVAGDFEAPEIDDEALTGLCAYYAIVHCSEAGLERALASFRRVLRPGGAMLLSFHAGEGAVRVKEFLGQAAAPLEFIFFSLEAILRRLDRDGWIVEEGLVRQPYRAVEYPSRRGYVLARKP
jgi:SAM-dependent methyltransferase